MNYIVILRSRKKNGNWPKRLLESLAKIGRGDSSVLGRVYVLLVPWFLHLNILRPLLISFKNTWRKFYLYLWTVEHDPLSTPMTFLSLVSYRRLKGVQSVVYDPFSTPMTFVSSVNNRKLEGGQGVVFVTWVFVVRHVSIFYLYFRKFPVYVLVKHIYRIDLAAHTCALEGLASDWYGAICNRYVDPIQSYEDRGFINKYPKLEYYFFQETPPQRGIKIRILFDALIIEHRDFFIFWYSALLVYWYPGKRFTASPLLVAKANKRGWDHSEGP